MEVKPQVGTQIIVHETEQRCGYVLKVTSIGEQGIIYAKGRYVVPIILADWQPAAVSEDPEQSYFLDFA